MKWKSKKFMSALMTLSLSLSLSLSRFSFNYGLSISVLEAQAAEHVHSDNCYKYGLHEHVGDGGVTQSGCYQGSRVSSYTACSDGKGKLVITPYGWTDGTSKTGYSNSYEGESWYEEYVYLSKYNSCDGRSVRLWMTVYSDEYEQTEYSPFAHKESYYDSNLPYKLFCKTCETEIMYTTGSSEGGASSGGVMTYYYDVEITEAWCNTCGWRTQDIYYISGGEAYFSANFANLCYIQHTVRVYRYKLNCGLDGVLETVKELCPTCGGTGKVSNAACTKCSGNKTVPISICNKVVTIINPKK